MQVTNVSTSLFCCFPSPGLWAPSMLLAIKKDKEIQGELLALPLTLSGVSLRLSLSSVTRDSPPLLRLVEKISMRYTSNMQSSDWKEMPCQFPFPSLRRTRVHSSSSIYDFPVFGARSLNVPPLSSKLLTGTLIKSLYTNPRTGTQKRHRD